MVTKRVRQKKERIPSAKKRDIQSKKLREANRSFKSKTKSSFKILELAIKEKDAPSVKDKIASLFSLMDKGVKTGRFKGNKAARIKSRFALKANAFQKQLD